MGRVRSTQNRTENALNLWQPNTGSGPTSPPHARQRIKALQACSCPLPAFLSIAELLLYIFKNHDRRLV
jgi:hypothetical protein